MRETLFWIFPNRIFTFTGVVIGALLLLMLPCIKCIYSFSVKTVGREDQHWGNMANVNNNS